jgi:hypothetical protein
MSAIKVAITCLLLEVLQAEDPLPLLMDRRLLQVVLQAVRLRLLDLPRRCPSSPACAASWLHHQELRGSRRGVPLDLCGDG